MALISELLGAFPKYLVRKGKYASQYSTRNGNLRAIEELVYWPLSKVLTEKYGYDETDAGELSEFILLMLTHDPAKRATAAECLSHRFLREGLSSTRGWLIKRKRIVGV